MINEKRNQKVIKARVLNALLGVGLLCFLSGGTAALADNTYTFNFTGLSSSSASDGAIQTFMNGVLGSAGSVALTGAVGSGAPCSTPSECSGGSGNYTADGHVVGPSSWLGTSSYTLANKDGGTFIINNNIGAGDDYINMAFTLAGGAQITSVSFDYEIFPDISCPDENNNDCGRNNANLPDIELTTSGGGGGTNVWSASAVVPGSPSYTHSPDSGFFSDELAPQLIGSTTVNGLTTLDLDFLDWPATIGINDVKITTSTGSNGPNNPVPEPASVLLLGSIGSLVLFKLRRRQA